MVLKTREKHANRLKPRFTRKQEMNQMYIDLRLNLQSPYFEMWQGMRAMYRLDEDFLNYMANRVIKKTLLTFMEDSDFAE